MKIAIISSAITGGGAENSMRILNKALNQTKHNSNLIALNKTPYDEHFQKDAYIVGRKHGGGLISLLRVILRLQNIINKNDYELCILNCDLPEFIFLFIRYEKSILIIEHSSKPWGTRKTIGKITRFLYSRKKNSYFASVSKNITPWQIGTKDFTILPNLVANIELNKTENQEIPRIIYIGRLVKTKRVDLVIRIAEFCKLNTLIIGEGPEEVKLRELVNQLKLHSLVQFAGYTINPWSIVSRNDLVVLTSEFEGKPLVLDEALALGVRCVVLETKELKDIYDSPLLHFCKNQEELISKIRELSKQNMESTENMIVTKNTSNHSYHLQEWLKFLESIN